MNKAAVQMLQNAQTMLKSGSEIATEAATDREKGHAATANFKMEMAKLQIQTANVFALMAIAIKDETATNQVAGLYLPGMPK